MIKKLIHAVHRFGNLLYRIGMWPIYRIIDKSGPPKGRQTFTQKEKLLMSLCVPWTFVFVVLGCLVVLPCIHLGSELKC